jgi:hypothetical protein
MTPTIISQKVPLIEAVFRFKILAGAWRSLNFTTSHPTVFEYAILPLEQINLQCSGSGFIPLTGALEHVLGCVPQRTLLDPPFD